MKKYALYGIGEIFLVMIGILLALQINNWNEGRKNLTKEKSLLSGLKAEFIDNRQALIDQNLNIQKQIDDIELILNLDSGNIPDSLVLYDLLRTYYGLRVTAFQPSQSTLDEAIYSGNLNLIRSDALRKELTRWIRNLEDSKVHEAKIINLKELELRPFMIECCPRGAEFQGEYIQVLNNYQFRTLMGVFANMLDTQINKRIDLLEIVDRILKDLEDSLI